MDDKVGAKAAKICIKRKWRPIEGKFSNLTNFNETCLKLILMIVPLKESTSISCSREIAYFGSTGSKCFKIYPLFSLEAGFSSRPICHVSRSNSLIVKYCKFGINIKLLHSPQLEISLKVSKGS